MNQNKNLKNDLIKNYLEIVSEIEIQKELDKNSIINERVLIIHSFIMNLCHHITTTYLGNKYLKNDEDISGHFNWAFNKTCNEFKQQKIDFKENIEIYDFFNEYFNVTLYENEDYNENFILNYWNSFFILFSNKKNRNDLINFIETYEMFNSVFENKINL